MSEKMSDEDYRIEEERPAAIASPIAIAAENAAARARDRRSRQCIDMNCHAIIGYCQLILSIAPVMDSPEKIVEKISKMEQEIADMFDTLSIEGEKN